MSPAENVALIWIAAAVTIAFVWHLIADHYKDDR